MNHIEKRRNLWYATLTIPADAREKLGKLRFVQSLKTANKHEALAEAAPLIAKWRAMIKQARGNRDALSEEALRWKRHLAEAHDLAKDEDEHGPLQQGLYELEDLLIERTKELEQGRGIPVADQFHSVATGKAQFTDSHFEEWKGQLTLKPKTIDQMVKDVSAMCSRFPTLEAINRKDVRKWLTEINASTSSATRILGNCRNYWGYLTEHEVVDESSKPFAPFTQATKSGKKIKESWVPFQPAEVVHLWEAARNKDDEKLADLILIGAYTGMRIEEICSMSFKDIDHRSMKVTDAKTSAGYRSVPVHSALVPIVQRLKKASKDGFLISGLTLNKYGDRSNAIGKRFGRLKVELGHSSLHVFHSIRKTFTTELENAGVPENVTADIVGHEKPTMTYGLYSGGNRYEVLKEAIEKVRYPFPSSVA